MKLEDVTSLGPNSATITAEGQLQVTGIGFIKREGEYNIVVDVGRNGMFDPAIDRIDRTGIGLSIEPLQGSTLYFPQIADGRFREVGFRTTLYLVAAEGGGELQIEFLGSDGLPMELTLGDLGTSSSFTIKLQTGESVSLETAGSGELKTGYARIIGVRGVNGTAILTRTDTATATVLYEAGVPATTPLTDFSIVVDSIGAKDTGLAIVNARKPGEPGALPQATIQLRLYDQNFRLIQQKELNLSPGEHRARFISELFPETAQTAREMLGVLSVASNEPVAVVTLRLRDDPALKFPEDVPNLTTFPVIPGRPDEE